MSEDTCKICDGVGDVPCGYSLVICEHCDGSGVEPVSDTELLNWLQRQLDKESYTGKCLFRWSEFNRGWRMHETSQEGAVPYVRLAIREAMIREQASR